MAALFQDTVLIRLEQCLHIVLGRQNKPFIYFDLNILPSEDTLPDCFLRFIDILFGNQIVTQYVDSDQIFSGCCCDLGHIHFLEQIPQIRSHLHLRKNFKKRFLHAYLFTYTFQFISSSRNAASSWSSGTLRII